MAATAKNVQSNFAKIKATPKCALLVPLIVPAINDSTTVANGTDWIKTWDLFIQAADAQHLANLIPGAVGKRYTALYAGPNAAAGVGEITTEQLAESVETEVAADVMVAEPVEHPVVAALEPTETDGLTIIDLPDMGEMTTFIPLERVLDVEALAEIATVFKSPDNVPFYLSEGGVNVPDSKKDKMVLMCEHLQGKPVSVSKGITLEQTKDMCAVVLAALSIEESNG